MYFTGSDIADGFDSLIWCGRVVGVQRLWCLNGEVS